jgi:hypothetical protein
MQVHQFHMFSENVLCSGSSALERSADEEDG